MTVKQNSKGTYYSYRDDGALECWGIIDMGVNPAPKHLRAGNLYLQKYKEPPCVTTNIVGKLRPTTLPGWEGAENNWTVVAFNYSYNEQDPNFTICAVAAANTVTGVGLFNTAGEDVPFSCHFHAIGLPAESLEAV